MLVYITEENVIYNEISHFLFWHFFFRDASPTVRPFFRMATLRVRQFLRNPTTYLCAGEMKKAICLIFIYIISRI